MLYTGTNPGFAEIADLEPVLAAVDPEGAANQSKDCGDDYEDDYLFHSRNYRAQDRSRPLTNQRIFC